MKKIICVFVFCLPIFIFARSNIAVFERQHTYNASPHDSRITAREKAMNEAQALLLQQLGPLIESKLKLAGNDITEEIRTYTLGRVQTQIVSGTKRFTENDRGNMTYSARFRMEIDTATLFRHLDNIVKQKEQARTDILARV